MVKVETFNVALAAEVLDRNAPPTVGLPVTDPIGMELIYWPPAAEVTNTSMLQVPFADKIDPLVRVKELLPMVIVPPPHCEETGVLKKVRPVGSVSVNVSPVTPESVGAVMVTLNLELTPGEIEVGLKVLETRIGGAVDTTVIELEVIV